MSTTASESEVDEAIRTILIPALEKLIAQHGKKEAERIFKAGAVAMGWDPMMWRIVDAEDVS